MNPLTKDNLISEFKELGLEPNDIVLVHSSFKSFGGVEGGPQTVIDSILEIIGNSGTLIVPTFNFDFCEKDPVFDIINTPSKMGIITELVRNNPNSIRTKDPVYSFSILGKYAKELSQNYVDDSYGKNSIFAKLREFNGKIMIIGLPYTNSMTFFHHVEEMQEVEYRFTKEFHGKYINKEREEEHCRISFRVRDLNRGIKTELDRMGKILENESIVKVKKIGKAVVRIMNASKVFDRTIKELNKNPDILHIIDYD